MSKLQKDTSLFWRITYWIHKILGWLIMTMIMVMVFLVVALITT